MVAFFSTVSRITFIKIAMEIQIHTGSLILEYSNFHLNNATFLNSCNFTFTALLRKRQHIVDRMVFTLHEHIYYEMLCLLF